MKWTFPQLALLALLAGFTFPLSLSATAAEGSATSDSELSEIDLAKRFADERRRIEEDMEPEGRYGGLSEREKDEVRDALSKAHEKIGQRGRVSDLSPSDQVAVFNALEQVNSVLAAAPAGKRKICERVLRVGSKIPETVCYTEAELREQSRGARGAKDYLEQRGRPGFDEVGRQ